MSTNKVKRLTMKEYREVIAGLLEKSRSRALHEFIYSLVRVYSSDKPRYEKSLRWLYHLYDEEGRP